jgi:hypothetical protein
LSGLDVFISYSRDDREAARRFADRLAEEGFSVWWDAALRSGETFDEVIESALNSAKTVIVLWSPRSVASRWVRAEATSADRKKKLIPVIIEPCDRPIIFELMHTTDLSRWDGSTTDLEWRSLVKDVKRVVERGAPEAGPASARGENREAGYPERRPERANDGPFARGNGNGNGGLPVRKVDNLIFAPVPRQAARHQSDPYGADLESEDRTRFYTRSDSFLEDQFHCLELTIGGRFEKRYVVSPPGLKIGRAAPADVILADSRVSRTHCVVELKEGGLQVSDLNSTNGTFVDGERVAGSAPLPIGSVLQVGKVSFTHELRTSADV